MKTTVRLHSYTNDNPNPSNQGITSCDFRGTNFIGTAEGDHHHTLIEIDVPEDNELVALTLAKGPEANQLLSRLEAEVVKDVHVPGVVPSLRIGVWDKQAPH